MQKFCLIIAAITISFIAGWCAFNFHFFRTPSGVVMSIKRTATLADTYVDVRQWGLVEWSEFPDLAWSLERSGHAELIPHQPIYIADRPEVEIHR